MVTLIEKNIKPQKEKIEKLITFEKGKFEETIEVTQEDLDYDKEYKQMLEMRKLISEKFKIVPSKISMKDIVKGVLQLINI
jgi:ribosomal protein S18